jgi:hypothetical protein
MNWLPASARARSGELDISKSSVQSDAEGHGCADNITTSKCAHDGTHSRLCSVDTWWRQPGPCVKWLRRNQSWICCLQGIVKWLKLTVAAKSELRVSRRCRQVSGSLGSPVEITCARFPSVTCCVSPSCTPTLNMPSYRLDTQAWRSQVLSFFTAA